MLEARAHLDALALPDAAARHALLDAAEARGLPTRGDEAWHYTNLRRLLAGHPDDAAARDVSFAAVEPLRVEFSDGVLVGDLPSHEGLTLTAQTFDAAESDEESSAMALYNLALLGGGCVVEVEQPISRPLEIALTGDAPAHLRHRIHVKKGGALTLIENCGARGYGNLVADIRVDEGGALNLVRLHDAGAMVALSRVEVAAGARFESITLMTGGTLARHETEAKLTGTDATANLTGVLLGQGARHADMTCRIDHLHPDTQSRTACFAALDDRARGVFQGKVVVHQDAQRSDAQQQSRALLLSSGAEMDAKPELEIYADDVACAHGATTSAPDSEALFFLRSRGLDEATARHLLVSGFLTQALDAVADAPLRAVLHDVMTARLEGGTA